MPVDPKPFAEYDLARRYQAAARNRINSLWDQLPAIEERVREKRIRSLMLAHGYWHPYRREAPPTIEDAPQWIIDAVDSRRCGQH